MKFPDVGGSNGDLESKDFVLLKDGQSVVGILRGDPVVFYTHWNGRFSKPCDGDECVQCQEGNKAKFRVRFNMVTKDGSTYLPKILEQGWKMFEAIRDLHESDYDLERTVLKITRKGSGQNDTRYSVTPLQGQTVNEELNRTLSKLTLYDLSPKKNKPTSEETPSESPSQGSLPSYSSEDAPF